METPIFTCSLCEKKKTYKSHGGLQRHETLKHYNYNIPPSHILSVPEHELSHLKKVMVREVGKRLKNHHSAVGKQVFSIHCSEHAFVGIFGQYIERYSPCGNFYRCRFKGIESCNILTEIFKNKQWGERNYGQGQISWVQLILNSTNTIEDNQNCINQNYIEQENYIEQDNYIEPENQNRKELIQTNRKKKKLKKNK
ncbi:hypothetical protein Glove_490g32 [Diversispora epigaea]|uniref:C2H2-type domain-containing protein n=1 Tax=Diversispora epigaea TaxID=1348612 RepID=A0A397GMZ9_9GLOM|nr:hypothetical protein Glove_490g32 [Diversispora epigaea]